MKKYKEMVIGIDNGCTGTISAFGDGVLIDFKEQFSFKWRKPHVKTKLSYMSRISYFELVGWLNEAKSKCETIVAVIERPMTDEKRLMQTLSSHHSQEAVMIALESCDIEYMTVDSSEWQKKYLPDISGSEILKSECAKKALAEYPKYQKLIKKHGDADAIYIARLVVDDKTKFISDENKPIPKPKIKIKKSFSTNFN